MDAECLHDTNLLFVQFSCVQTAAQSEAKYSQLATIVACSWAVALLFSIYIFFLKQNGKIKNLKWDVQTITAGDYTVEQPILAADYERWLDECYKADDVEKDEIDAPAFALKKYLIARIEKFLLEDIVAARLSKVVMKKKTKGNNKAVKSAKIVDIVFAFNNTKLVNEL